MNHTSTDAWITADSMTHQSIMMYNITLYRVVLCAHVQLDGIEIMGDFTAYIFVDLLTIQVYQNYY